MRSRHIEFGLDQCFFHSSIDGTLSFGDRIGAFPSSRVPAFLAVFQRPKSVCSSSLHVSQALNEMSFAQVVLHRDPFLLFPCAAKVCAAVNLVLEFVPLTLAQKLLPNASRYGKCLRNVL